MSMSSSSGRAGDRALALCTYGMLIAAPFTFGTLAILGILTATLIVTIAISV